jgi:hypothetical protein
MASARVRAAVGAICVLVVTAGVAIAAPTAGAATTYQLVLPQGAAFGVLGHSCGGITEQVYATGFDAATGYPDGDAYLLTRCSTGGRGGGTATYTAWASATWDFTGTLISDARLASAPTVNPTLSVSDPNGNQLTNSAAKAYLTLATGYVPVPRLTGLSATIGPAAGGTAVTITGTGFSQATAVDFGGLAAAQFTVTSDTSISAVTATHAGGTIDVTVTSPGGTSATSPADQFTFVPTPSISGLSPSSGPVTGGTPVTISGSGFTYVTQVLFGDQPAGFTIASDTEIDATAPAGENPHTESVTVTSVGGTSAQSPADIYSYVAAATVSVSPDTGPARTPITITGSGFTAGETVRVTYLTGLASPASVTVCSVVAGSAGSISCTGHVPRATRAGAAGAHTISAVGATSGTTATTVFTLS